jgi:hypothetical protein
MKQPSMSSKKIGMVGPTTAPPKTVASQPAAGTVGMKPFSHSEEDEQGEVPHFANNVGHSQTQGDRQR